MRSQPRAPGESTDRVSPKRMPARGIKASIERFRTSLVTVATSRARGAPYWTWYMAPAPATWAVSWIDAPRKSPASSGWPPKIACARIGYPNIAAIPNTVMQEMA